MRPRDPIKANESHEWSDFNPLTIPRFYAAMLLRCVIFPGTLSPFPFSHFKENITKISRISTLEVSELN